jgi:hypothetical protein
LLTRSVSDDEIISAHDSTDLKKPLFERGAVAFWFRQIVHAKMIESGVYKGRDRVDAVQEALHPGPPGGASKREGEGEPKGE